MVFVKVDLDDMFEWEYVCLVIKVYYVDKGVKIV